MIAIEDLLRMDRAGLARLLHDGHPIDPRALDDTEYRGISLGLPAFIERLTWKTFKKVFCRDGERLRGWNVRMKQNGIAGPFEPLMKRGAFTFGHFEVVACDGRLDLDYGRGHNGALDPLRALCDPLVSLEAGSVELLLGRSDVGIGTLRFATPSYFCLERDVPLSHRAEPPRQ
jgi:hypothetical protein